jgi:hypothetical protein
LEGKALRVTGFKAVNSDLCVHLAEMLCAGVELSRESKLRGRVSKSSFDNHCQVHHSLINYRGFNVAVIDGDNLGVRWRYARFNESNQPEVFNGLNRGAPDACGVRQLM